MRSILFSFTVLIALLLAGCSASKKVAVDNPELAAMITDRQLEIEVNSARPTVTNAMNQVAQSGLIAPGSTIMRIDLNGSSNYLKIMGDSVSANLSYYGERQMAGGYNNKTGIEFDGIPESLEIEKDDLKKKYKITFAINDGLEGYRVFAEIGPSLSSTISISSTHRTRISYSGKAAALNENE